MARIAWEPRAKRVALTKAIWSRELNGFISLGLVLGQRDREFPHGDQSVMVLENTINHATDHKLSQRALLSLL